MDSLKLRLLIVVSLAFLMTDWAKGQVYFDFEVWDDSIQTGGINDTVIENWNPVFPEGWFYTDETEWRGVSQTTDATTGNYALVLSGYYTYFTTRIFLGADEKHPGIPIDYRPSRIAGDYKSLLLGDCDSLRAYIDVFLTKFSPTKGRDTIGEAHVTLLETEDDYEEFSSPIEYNDPDVKPDSIHMAIYKVRSGHCSPSDCWECSHVFFDNLLLESGKVTMTDPVLKKETFETFYDASQNGLVIENCLSNRKSFIVSDVQGHAKSFELLGEEQIVIRLSMSGQLIFVSDGIHAKKILVPNR